MLGPMALLALLCAIIGLFPSLALSALEAAARSWALGSGEAFGAGLSLASHGLDLSWISWAGLGLVALFALIFLALRASSARARRMSGEGRPLGTWDCGYAAPTARMQYTASSFGRGIAGLFSPGTAPKGRRLSVEGYFPPGARFDSDMPDAVLETFLPAATRALGRFLPRVRALQRGQTHLYLLYVLAITIALLAFGGLGVPL
jgi:hydrogenase-4 component B